MRISINLLYESVSVCRSVRDLFFRLAETKTTNDFRRISGHVFYVFIVSFLFAIFLLPSIFSLFCFYSFTTSILPPNLPSLLHLAAWLPYGVNTPLVHLVEEFHLVNSAVRATPGMQKRPFSKSTFALIFQFSSTKFSH